MDSNRYTDFCLNVPRAVEALRSAEEIWITLIVLGELRAGFAHGTRREQNERTLTRFLASPRVEVLAPDERTTHVYASVYAELRRKGRPIPSNDLWIAALVLQHGLVLFARDSDFDAVTQLARV